jgi:hypothetical protein
MSNKMIAITVGIIILLLFLMMSGKRNNMLEHLSETPTTSLTDIDVEALQNLSSMYNIETDTVSLNNATIAGDLTVAGTTKSNFYGFNGDYTGPESGDTVGLYKKNWAINLYNKDTASVNVGNFSNRASVDSTGLLKSPYMRAHAFIVDSDITMSRADTEALVKNSSTTGKAAGVIYAASSNNMAIKVADSRLDGKYNSGEYTAKKGKTVEYKDNGANF